MKTSSRRHGPAFFLLLVLLVNTIGHVTSRKSGAVSFVPRTPHADIRTDKGLGDPLSAVEETISHAVSRRGGAVSAQVQETGGALAFVILDVLFRKVFKANNIAFPSQLGGCCILFGVLLLSELVSPGTGDMVFTALSPGAGLLAKWLPVFFVPGLAMIPLAPSMGSSFEVVKVLGVVVLGFYFSAFTAAFSVLALRKYQGLVTEPSIPTIVEETASAPVKPFSPELVAFLLKGLCLSGAVSIGASRADNQFATPLQTIFMAFTTFAGYVWGARLPSSFNQVVHPLVTSTIITFLVTKLAGLATGASFNDVLSTYKSGSLAPMKAGAGDILLFLLGPSVVSFATAIYSRKRVVADNFLVILTGVIVASVGGLFGTAAFVRLIQLGGAAGRVLRLSVLPRNVTTPLAIAITNMLGGDISYACAVVVLTGIFGGTFGARTLTAVGIKDPVSRGIGIGASAQGLGVASMSNEKEAFPFAAISMVLTAVAATTMVSIPAVKESIINLATGN